MGMTIDERIAQLKKLKSFHNGSYGASINFAIDTMRKYQKIREIAFPLQFCSRDKLEHEAIMKICEVLEDAND